MEVGKRIKLRRKELKISADEIAERIGVSRSTIFRYENGDIEKMPTDVLNSIAEVLKTTPGSLMGWEDVNNDINAIYNKLNSDRQRKVYSFAEAQLHAQNNKVVPLVGQTAANPTELAYDDGIVDEHVSTDVPNQADCALVVNGDSMEPKFKNGSIVFYRSQPTVENGECAIIEIDGSGVTLKKFYYFPEDNKVVLKSLNDNYDDRELEANRVRILGKVIN